MELNERLRKVDHETPALPACGFDACRIDPGFNSRSEKRKAIRHREAGSVGHVKNGGLTRASRAVSGRGSVVGLGRK